MASILIGVGAARVLSRRRNKIIGRAMIVLCLLTIPTYIAAPAVAERLKVMTRPRTIPYRNDYTYFLRPWKTGDRGAEQFAVEVFNLVEPNAAILADPTTSPPLLYLQEVRAERPDVWIISRIGSTAGAPQLNEQTIDKLLAERAVYVVSPMKGYCPDFLLEGRLTFQQTGHIWRVTPK